VSDCRLTSNEQYEELDISKNFGKPYKNTNFDKEEILANYKSFMNIDIGGMYERCVFSAVLAHGHAVQFSGVHEHSAPCLSMYVVYCMFF
jgi:hypothetical protein